MTYPLIIANWKMNLTAVQARDWCGAFASAWGTTPQRAQVVVCPSFVHLLFLSGRLLELGFSMGAQDCALQESGAYTGDVSAAMLKDAGCGYVLVGHSERRRLHQESNEQIRAKAQQVRAHAMTPVLCVGETLEEHQAGLTQAVLTRQIQEGFSQQEGALEEIVVAYEPVWAIGTGKTPTPEEIEKAHAFLKEFLFQYGPAEGIKVLYGGSVSETNARALLAINGVDGLLVGGASLQACVFQKILEACEKEPSAQGVKKPFSSKAS